MSQKQLIRSRPRRLCRVLSTTVALLLPVGAASAQTALPGALPPGKPIVQPRPDIPTPAPAASGLTGLTFNATYDSFDYKAALYVADGAIVRAKSTAGEVKGRATGKGARGLTINVNADRTNGLYVTGKSDFTLADSTINIVGNSAGWDENFGIGTGVTVGKDATLTLRNVTITTEGIKAAPAAAANGTLRVYDSRLISRGGKVPAENLVPGSGPGYVGAPEALNIRGTARGSNVVGSGKAYYYRSKIIAAGGWGAMSTDSAQPHVYLEVNDCDVEVHDGGYGTYADINAEVVINNSRFHSPDYTGIISQNGKITLNGVSEDTARVGVMIHAPGRDFLKIGDLTIKGGHLATKNASVLVKSANADILFDGADLAPADGVLLRSEVNSSKRTALMQWLLAPKKPDKVETGPVTGIRATFANMNSKGRIEHLDTTREMALTFKATNFTGAIVGTVWEIADVKLSLDAASHWTATENAYLTLVGTTDTRQFDAPSGVTITALAGTGTTLKGRYPLPGGGTLLVKG